MTGSGGRLVGVGVGPGDPELVTLKAARVLREADAVVVPVMGSRIDEVAAGRAEATARAHADPARVHRAVFALDDRGGLTAGRQEAWDAAARLVLDLLDAGAPPRTVAFATIGDPNVYSTFTYLAATVTAQRPGVEVATVPGITAMQALAAASGTVLCEGREPLTLLPLTGDLHVLDAALTGGGTVVAYKGGRRTREVLDAVRRHGRLDGAVLGAELGLPGERVVPAERAGDAEPYLSTLLVPARRTTRGGKL